MEWVAMSSLRASSPPRNLLCLLHWQAGLVLVVKKPPANAGDVRDAGQSLGQEGALEEGMATHSSILAWRIPWTKAPGGLQSMGSQRGGHN